MRRHLLLAACFLLTLTSTTFAANATAPETDEEEDEFIIRVPAPCVRWGFDAPPGAKLVGFPVPEKRVNRLISDLSWIDDLKYGDVVGDLLFKMPKEQREELLRQFLTQPKPNLHGLNREELSVTLLIELKFELCGVVLRAGETK